MEVFCEVVECLYGNYVVVVLLSALLYSVATIGVKILADTVSIFQILAVRSLFAGVAAALVIHRGEEKYFGDPQTYALLLLRAILGAVGLTTATAATFLLPLVDAAFLINIYPVFTAWLAFLLRIEKPTCLSSAAILGCFLSTGLIIHPPFLSGGDDKEWGLERIAGLAVALCSQICLSATMILIAKIGPSTTPASHTFVQSIAVFSICAPFLATPLLKPLNFELSWEEIGLFIMILLSGTAFQPLLIKGLQFAPPTKGAVLFLSNMLYSAGFGIIVLGDEFYITTFIGGVILILCVILVTYERSKDKPDVEDSVNDDNNTKLLIDA